MVRYGYPVAPMVIGLLLARPTEGNLLRSYQLSGGDLGFLMNRPIAMGLLALLVLSLLWPLLRGRFRKLWG